ncbi:NirD/YgiW/YdeI family stress tolerance protein [Aliivibrio sp. S4TY2]|uniref:YgiW/YdeI family stress tolerance OB fold protein n=1 Tax=unclassified Aliivibrio TaxID=2645654 RepID=UPI00237877E2|nr:MULTISPECIES: NirD/YgiW/YdeI family stress tolerance protein [unclassified Aliivibrio]MDD9155127.1 NirD/YgiW/YdeI family stress tolerance protein [Aliivibrio sp. S4TY2]MDD9159321.1 NirD/YgiW/YdeI family stress tolerance protein [Aliivibrio sp. S4TY1]MDD9163129.1 NirD/YgiW/YdeI family stress tolerance protein [Aliivibrio sp. S4MY2]MDD9167320.1 NirD/YgiW/YdeI family stress tolerance protein [Aliivibrio sp. S4MY4]MDD9184206.1 NirD/YgiW/YdeI family stress tolerance protein [Aliivibrio sp. S4MY3
MKKRHFLFTLILACSSTFALANDQAANYQDEFSKPVDGINTVESVLNASTVLDDTPILLTGYLVESLGKEVYVFKDDTGTLNVKIDGDKMPTLQVKPNDKVTLKGEINKEQNYIIYVDSITVD